MLSKRLIKYFKSLQLKKYRLQERKFLVEGAKGVSEVLKSGFQVTHLLTTSSYLSSITSELEDKAEEILECKPTDLAQVGTFKTNNAAIAVVKIPDSQTLVVPEDRLSIVLDDVRDPGNLGTIIRIADWYGIENIYCSKETADVYNPKVINATMGSFTRVAIHYVDIQALLSSISLPIYGALLSGDSIYKSDLKQSGLVVMGNESNGISEDLIPYISHALQIPARGGAESLNVAIATAVILDNFYRS
ncbi:TrmH family RNA methyltransferase [Roseivirga sp.]|uniref:TrmH family RNA methyltransferase n=1 Tax=Roseivirga sp. TaxID=1964215 RepID=UPI003B8DC31D